MSTAATSTPASKARIDMIGDVAELVLDGPPLNLFDGQMIADVATAVRSLRGSGARAVLVRAEGKVFCAGVDVHHFRGRDNAGGAALMQTFLDIVHELEALPVPTIAVVHGLNLTIGFELVLGCDLLWAAEEASMGLVEATVGLTPGGGGTQRLVARAGVARAAEAVLTGQIYGATELQQWGVVNRVLPRATLLEQARAHAAALAAGPTLASGWGKQILLAARDGGVEAADAISSEVSGRVFETADLEAGIGSLLEHGPGKAVFSGR